MIEQRSVAARPTGLDAGEGLFESLVDAAEELRAVWKLCVQHPAVSDDVRVTFNLRRYGEVPTLEMYVDAEAKSGKAFAWCVEIERSGSGPSWGIERSVRMNDREGQHVLIDLGRTELDSACALTEQLLGLVKELVRTFDRVDLTA